MVCFYYYNVRYIYLKTYLTIMHRNYLSPNCVYNVVPNFNLENCQQKLSVTEKIDPTEGYSAHY